jgi:hypothetical protein
LGKRRISAFEMFEDEDAFNGFLQQFHVDGEGIFSSLKAGGEGL